ncbi:ATP-binding protein [Lactobacillus johnsonii]
MCKNRSYDSLVSTDQDLTFKILEQVFKDELGIRKITDDILITLEFKNRDSHYTNAGALLADQNNYRGIDIVRFGENINIMLDRQAYEQMSILEEYKQAIEKYRQYYQREEIIGSERKTIQFIPEKAFRKAVANALVHRTGDVNAQIKISMFDDRIEITSPGGLPDGFSKEEYLPGQISILRNPIIAGVFFRLGLIEQFGTGVQRILKEYSHSIIQPQFLIYDNSITIKLPVGQGSL